MAWQPNGNLLATAGYGYNLMNGEDKQIRIWNVSNNPDSNNAPIKILDFDEFVHDLNWHPQSKLLLITTQHHIHIWNVETNTFESYDFREIIGYEYTLLYSSRWNARGDLILIQYNSGSSRPSTLIFDPKMLTTHHMYTPSCLDCVIWFGDDEIVWSYSGDYRTALNYIRFGYGYSNRNPITSLHNPNKGKFFRANTPVYSSQISPSNKFISGITEQSQFIVWEIDSDEIIYDWANNVEKVFWSPNEEFIALDTSENVLDIIYPKDGRYFAKFNYSYWLDAIEWSPDSTQLAIVEDGVLTIWQSKTTCRTPSFLRSHIGLKQCN